MLDTLSHMHLLTPLPPISYQLTPLPSQTTPLPPNLPFPLDNLPLPITHINQTILQIDLFIHLFIDYPSDGGYSFFELVVLVLDAGLDGVVVLLLFVELFQGFFQTGLSCFLVVVFPVVGLDLLL